MAGSGNKKNKRGSIPSSTSGAPRIEIFERTPENDYGVLSDPDENALIIPMMNAVEQDPEPTAEEHQPPVSEENRPVPAEGSHTPIEPSIQPHLPQDSQPSSQQQSPSLQPQISETKTLSKSLNTLQLKLSRDKNFSKKITLHTFFSYIILAIEIQRSCSASISRISPQRVEELIEYMIHHHSASEEIQSYLQTLYTTGVIKNLIEAVIEFNKDQTDAIDKLVTTEQIELEMAAVEEENTSASAASAFSSASASSSSASSAASSTSASSASTVPDTISSSDTATSQPLPQTPQQRGGFFKLMRCFFSVCCGLPTPLIPPAHHQ